jgi:membrane protein implicated in regulation of membrane protease activity
METKKPNWFVRILIILLCIFIGGLIYFNFFWSCPPAQISTGLLVLVAFLTVLVLSEAFDNFSIIKLISLSRTVNETENKNQELKKENSDLRNQIISISTSISQKQINSTFVLTDELAKMLSVRQADEPEKQQKQKETEQEAEQETTATTTTTTTVPPAQEPATRRYINSSRYEEVALPKFLATEGLSQLPIISDAKFTNQFQQIDPVSEFSPIFDGYIKTIDTEIFIEMRIKNRSMIMLRERLYLMLSKINYYRNIKRVNAYLFLVLIIRPDEEQNESTFERIKKEFEPAISNGLLRIREIEITAEENQQILDEQR